MERVYYLEKQTNNDNRSEMSSTINWSCTDGTLGLVPHGGIQLSGRGEDMFALMG